MWQNTPAAKAALYGGGIAALKALRHPKSAPFAAALPEIRTIRGCDVLKSIRIEAALPKSATLLTAATFLRGGLQARGDFFQQARCGFSGFKGGEVRSQLDDREFRAGIAE
jgi:hypothetical protein